MNIKQKVQFAESAIRSIADHDDAPAEEVTAALKQLRKTMDSMERAAEQRREKPK